MLQDMEKIIVKAFVSMVLNIGLMAVMSDRVGQYTCCYQLDGFRCACSVTIISDRGRGAAIFAKAFLGIPAQQEVCKIVTQ